jgi:hypothetical protein
VHCNRENKVLDRHSSSSSINHKLNQSRTHSSSASIKSHLYYCYRYDYAHAYFSDHYNCGNYLRYPDKCCYYWIVLHYDHNFCYYHIITVIVFVVFEKRVLIRTRHPQSSCPTQRDEFILLCTHGRQRQRHRNRDTGDLETEIQETLT